MFRVLALAVLLTLPVVLTAGCGLDLAGLLGGLTLPDRDEDGTPDRYDDCPDDPAKTYRGNCGCGQPETPGCGADVKSIIITRPVGGGDNPQYPWGSTLAIRWTSTGDISGVKIELLYDPSAFGDPSQAAAVDTVIAYSTENDGSYEWTVPANQHDNSDYFVRVSDANDSGVYGVSREISVGGSGGGSEQKSITVTQPSGGGDNPQYPWGSTLAIRWTSTGDISGVKIELLYDASANGDPQQAAAVDTVIAYGTDNDGSYDWTVPANQHDNSDYFVRVSDANDSSVYDVSREISVGGTGGGGGWSGQKSITVTQPAGGGDNPQYPWGSTLAIRWTSTGDISEVKIELLYDPSAFGDPSQAAAVDTVIAYGTDNDGSYDWTVPANQHDNSDYFVRVSDANDSSVYDVSREISVGGNGSGGAEGCENAQSFGGHYYELVHTRTDWNTAKANAEGRVCQGMWGHLVTITSAEENAFVCQLLAGAPTEEYWIGAFQPAGSEEPDGNWQWVTGETWGYTNWNPPRQPDNTWGIENVIHIYASGAAFGYWNDAADYDSKGYIVEYE